MLSFPYTIKPFEADIFGAASPSMMMRLCTYSTKLKGEAEGISSSALMEKLGAVWMLARMKVEQTRHIYEDDVIELRVTPRSIDKGSYTREVHVMCGGEEVAFSSLVFIVVNFKQRSIIRPSVVEDIWSHAVPPTTLPPLKKLRMPQGAEKTGEHVVTYAQCDSNGHFSSANYADVICEHCDYWSGDPKIMTSIQVDFNAECKPGEHISLETCESDGLSYMRGVHPSGGAAFTASWKMENYC